MRGIGAIAGTVLVCFLIVLGFLWVREGSLERAGADVDEGLAKIDHSTKPLQNEVKDLGQATKESIDRATDGDDRT
ncbi:MAG: hypothetical protein GC155_12390 [Alphaproteobacteria bacterium]|nr:hypothetical protein [Alphaproteobacteria bacterium]